jgi:hypothetical protein
MPPAEPMLAHSSAARDTRESMTDVGGSAAFDGGALVIPPSPHVGRAAREMDVVEAAPSRFAWLTRPRRILLALAAVWFLNVVDLAFTLFESTRHAFVELNPLAARLLGAPPQYIILYKLVLVALGSAILLVLRRQRIAELGAWFLAATYASVAIRWAIYYEHVLESLNDPAVNVTLLINH